MDFIEVKCSDGRVLRIRLKDVLFRGSSLYQEIAIYDTVEFGKCLFLNGVIQSTEKDHEFYDRQILKKLRPSDRHLLILGGGDGFIAEMALRSNPEINITIVDLDEKVVDVCRKYFLQKVFDNPNVKVVIKDALDFILTIKDEKFDGIVSDMTDFPIGYDNRLRKLFSNILKASRRISRENCWISLYGGVKGLTDSEGQEVITLLNGLLKKYFYHTEYSEVLIPSFGESCYFLYGEKVIK